MVLQAPFFYGASLASVGQLPPSVSECVCLCVCVRMRRSEKGMRRSDTGIDMKDFSGIRTRVNLIAKVE